MAMSSPLLYATATSTSLEIHHFSVFRPCVI